MICANCGREIPWEQYGSITMEACGYEISFCNFDCMGKAAKRTTRLMKKIGVKRLSIRLEKAGKSNGGVNMAGGTGK